MREAQRPLSKAPSNPRAWLPLVGAVIHVGGRMATATADGRLVGPDGKRYAHASTTCFIFDAP